MQAGEPATASFLHTIILAQPSLAKSMAHLLANKLQNRTLLGTQLMRIISAAYDDDPVRSPRCFSTFSPLQIWSSRHH